MSESIANFLEQVINQRNLWRGEDQKKDEECGEEDEDFEPSQCWFRGSDKRDYPLIPTLYRKTGYKLRKYPRAKPDEDEIRFGFRSRAMQMKAESDLPTTEKEWYFLMRHYGAPTRLLDWTEGALLALYFAVRTLKEPADVAVWMLDPEWLNWEVHKLSGVMLPEFTETDPWFPKPFDEKLHPPLPLAIDPPHVARRLTVQRSHFTIHGTVEDGLSEVLKKPNPRLVRFDVSATDIVQILDDLYTCGIAESTVFPDLDGLSRELQYVWGGE